MKYGQILPDLQRQYRDIDQKSGEIGTAQVILQPIDPKSDRLLVPVVLDRIKHCRKKKMRSIWHYALMFMTLAITTANIHAQPAFVIKFSLLNDLNSPKGSAALYFKELAEKMTKGKVRVDIYPEGKLVNDNEELDALQLNAVQMLAPSLSKLSTLGLHEFGLFDLPYLFPDHDSLHHVTQGEIGRKLLNTLKPKGIIGLGFWDNGFKSMFTDKPVINPADLRGLKMRVQSSAVLDSEMRALGAIPVNLTFPETLEALKKKSINGTENTPSNFYSPDLTGIPKYVTVTNHGYLGYAVLASKEFWDGLPAEIQVQLTSAMNKTTRYANKIAGEKNARDLNAFKTSGKINVRELTDAEKKLWHDALLPVQKQMASRIGTDLIAEVHGDIREHRQEALPHP